MEGMKMAGVATGTLAFLSVPNAQDLTLWTLQVAVGVFAVLYGWNRWQRERIARKAAERAARQRPSDR